MALKSTIEEMKNLLLEISHDLEKSERGNKAASQRVRTNTIKFAKISKMYRKESVSEGRKEKKGAGKAPIKKAKGKKIERKKGALKKKTKSTTTAHRRKK